MSRYRLQPSRAQEQALLEHCGHARFVWNLAVEQHAHWRPGRSRAPGFAEQCRQLTQARAENEWLRAGSVIVQQQALKDFAQAMANFFGTTHRRPTFRRRGRGEGFRIVAVKSGDVRRLSRNVGEVRIPKVGWVRLRWSRAVPAGVKAFRITRDRAGRWQVAFAVIPEPTPAPGTGGVVGVDRGVAVSAALSTGQLLNAPGLRDSEKARLLRLLRKLARARRGSRRRDRVKAAIAQLKTREVDLVVLESPAFRRAEDVKIRTSRRLTIDEMDSQPGGGAELSRRQSRKYQRVSENGSGRKNSEPSITWTPSCSTGDGLLSNSASSTTDAT
ncbi:RNA-guided endonuclease TnpB family protein [Nonomuraea sp. KM90]|uniref:RNA-guided endonuclease TnpB family protein n=1 Tax=Nonomuraea sp. KM90 TaxID=3457428 RepID=UPI003FCD055C